MAPSPNLMQCYYINTEKLKFWRKAIENKNEHFSSNSEKKKTKPLFQNRTTASNMNNSTLNSSTDTILSYSQSDTNYEHFIWNENEYYFHDWTKLPLEGLKSTLRQNIVHYSDETIQQDLKCWKNDIAMFNNTNEILIPKNDEYKLLSENTSIFTTQSTQTNSSVDERREGDENAQLPSSNKDAPVLKNTKNPTKLKQIRDRITNFWHTGPTFVHLSSPVSQNNLLNGKQKRFSWKKIVSNFLRLHHPSSSADLLSSQQHNSDGDTDDEENEKKAFFALLQSILEQQRKQTLSAIPEWMDEQSEDDFLDIPIMETIGHLWKNRKQHDRNDAQNKSKKEAGQGTKKKKKRHYKSKQDKKD